MTDASPHRNNIAIALKSTRKARGLSQEDFGLVSSRTYLSTLERGIKSPTLNKLDDLAEVFGLHPLTLLTLAYAPKQSQTSADEMLAIVRGELSAILKVPPTD